MSGSEKRMAFWYIMYCSAVWKVIEVSLPAWKGLSYHCERKPHWEPYSRQKNIGPSVLGEMVRMEVMVDAFRTATFLAFRAALALALIMFERLMEGGGKAGALVRREYV